MVGRRELAEVIARELASEILNNTEKYRLRHRCALKVTMRIASSFIREKYDDALAFDAGLRLRVMRALAKILRGFGYRAMVRRASGTIVYYFVPKDCNEVIDGAFEPRERRGRKKEAMATTEEA